MLQELTLPAISENVESGEVIAVLVSVGDVVEKDQPVVELETEKAAFEVPSPQRGTIAEIDVKPGQTVKVGEILAKLDTDAQAKRQPETKPRPEPRQAAPPPAKPKAAGPPAEAGPVKPAVEARPQQQPAAQAEAPKPGVPIAAAPSVRQLARELGVDIADVPVGPGGRISQDDVKQYARSLISGAPTPAPAPVPGGGTPAVEPARPLPDFAQWGDVDRQPMSKTRRTIADTMFYAWTHIPHVTQYDRAEITELETFRKAHAAEVEKAGGKLSITSILVKIAASALKAFPQFNASVDMEHGEIIYKKYCHIAVAVDTDRGLLVPVVRDVDRKSIVEISVELSELARKTRDKQITPDELSGGCFTVSNLGGIGGTTFAPIVYWPQVAILGICRSAWEATPRDGAIRERLILPLSLSFDHRVIDGADGARFLHWIAQALEQPLLMMM
jgi:pyruvate dehydrogenase E2 component (dihydrolipoamide acetyltransferase)